MVRQKVGLRPIACVFTACLLLFVLVLPIKTSAVAAVSITSPSAGATLPAGNVTVTGTAGAGQTVILSRDNMPLKMVIADGSGNWNTTISNMAAGSVTLTAKAIENSQYAYFGAVTQDFSSNTMNRIRLSDNTVNPGGGSWPVATSSTRLVPGSVYSNDNGILYYLPLGDSTAVPAMFDTNNPADYATVSNYESDPGLMGGAFNLDGTKWYGFNADLNNVSVVDVATNTQIGSPITVGNKPQSGSRGSDGRIYVSNSTDNTVSVIDTNTDAVVETIVVPPCPTYEGLASMAFPQGEDYFYVACAPDGVIFKLSLSEGSHLDTIDISDSHETIAGMFMSPDNRSIYASGIFNTSSQDQITVIDTGSGSISEIISLTGGSFTGVLSPDGQFIYAGIQDGFTGSVIDVISTATNTIVDTIDTSSVGVPGVIAFGPASYATASVTFTVTSTGTTQSGLANTGQNATLLVLGAGAAIAFATHLYVRTRRHIHYRV